MRGHLLPTAALATLALAGCWLPIGTAAPQSATTVGKGSAGVTVHGEVPTIDLLATQTDEDTTDDYALMPWPTMSLGVQYGLLEHFDIELSLEGTFLIIPVPYGLSAGGRLQLVHTDTLAMAAAVKVGYISGSDNDDKASARYAMGTLVGQLRNLGAVRPGLAVSAIPIRVHQTVLSDPLERYNAFAASATVSLTFAFGPVEIGPFANFVHFRSPNLNGATTIGTGGLMVALRGQKDPPTPPAPPPMPPPAPASGPPGG